MQPIKNHDKKQKSAHSAIQNSAVRAIVQQPPSPTDPNGSYTGRPANPNERPTQDADDL